MRGAWLAKWVEHVTLDGGVLSSNPTLGVEFTLKKKKVYMKILGKLEILPK